MAFDTFYSSNPWDGLSKNQRDWYVPELLDVYKRTSIYRPFVPVSVDLSAQRTQTMIFNLVLDYEANINPIGNRDLWIDAMTTDSMQLTVTTERHGDKVQMHKFDDMITYWKESGSAGLANIVRSRLAPSMVRKLDTLARNAFFQTHWPSYAMDSVNNDGFEDIVVGDLFDLGWVDKLQLRMATHDLPGFSGQPGSMVAIVSPGTLYSIKNEAGTEWITYQQYTEEGRKNLFAGEVGSYRGTRFIPTNDSILHNAGTVTKQVSITSPVSAGDGAATSYKGYDIGQSGATATIQCSDFDAGEFNVNDIVTIHAVRTSAHGVTNGVDPYDGLTFHRVVAAVDATANTISFNKPVLHDYTTDLGGSVYGYITTGIDIHCSLFIAGPGAVVAGVSQPPELHTPPPVDDFVSMYRFSWDAYLKFQPFRSEWCVPVFHAGYVSMDGTLKT